MIRGFLWAVAGLSIAACTQLEVTWADGTTVRSSGAMLVNRKGEVRVSHEWIDSSGTLHLVRVEQRGEENTDNQAEMLRYVGELGRQAGGAR